MLCCRVLGLPRHEAGQRTRGLEGGDALPGGKGGWYRWPLWFPPAPRAREEAWTDLDRRMGARKGKQSGSRDPTGSWAVEVLDQCVLDGHVDSGNCAPGQFGP